MSQNIEDKLLTRFCTFFPEYAESLDAAKSEEDINTLCLSLVSEAKQKLQKALEKSNLGVQETDQNFSILLTQQAYNDLINAWGDDIKTNLLKIIDTLQELKGMENHNPDPKVVAQKLVDAGVVGIIPIPPDPAPATLPDALGVIVEALELEAPDVVGVGAEVAAAEAGVAATGVGVVIAIVLLIVVTIICTILYLVKKPANCIALLINEFDEDLIKDKHENVHGKEDNCTKLINGKVKVHGFQNYYLAGIIVATKATKLFGTQYGVTFKSDNLKLALGMDCPLTGIFKRNNCYCAFGKTAKDAAEQTDKKNVQYYEDFHDTHKISIRCNSKWHSTAYYIARARYIKAEETR